MPTVSKTVGGSSNTYLNSTDLVLAVKADHKSVARHVESLMALPKWLRGN